MINIIGKRKWFFLISAIVIVIGIISLAIFGLEPGVDFSSGTTMTLRFDPAVAQIKQALQAGRFGRLSFIGGFVPWWRDQQYYNQGGWKGTQVLDGGGALMNQAIHIVDLLQYLAGPVNSVQALTARIAHPQIEVEDTAVATLEYENTRTAHKQRPDARGPL